MTLHGGAKAAPLEGVKYSEEPLPRGRGSVHSYAAAARYGAARASKRNVGGLFHSFWRSRPYNWLDAPAIPSEPSDGCASSGHNTLSTATAQCHEFFRSVCKCLIRWGRRPRLRRTSRSGMPGVDARGRSGDRPHQFCSDIKHEECSIWRSAQKTCDLALSACPARSPVGTRGSVACETFLWRTNFRVRWWRCAAAIVLLAATTACNRKKIAVAPPPPPVITSAPEKSAAPVRRVKRAPAPRPIERETTPPLESVRTEQEKREMLELIKGTIARAEANVAALRRRPLSADTARELGRVDSFLRQARAWEEANDLVAARVYAQRAELLSNDLLNQ